MLQIVKCECGETDMGFDGICRGCGKDRGPVLKMADIKADAARWRWLKGKLSFELGSYNGPDFLSNATESDWFMVSEAIFKGVNKEPESVDVAVDVAMKEQAQPPSGQHVLCWFCKMELIWDSDADAEESGYERPGIIAHLHCPNCQASVECTFLEPEEEESIS